MLSLKGTEINNSSGFGCINTKCSGVTGWVNMGTGVQYPYYWSSTEVYASTAYNYAYYSRNYSNKDYNIYPVRLFSAF